MVEKITLGSQSSLLEGKTVGEAPFGIPVNIQIKGEMRVKPFSNFEVYVSTISRHVFILL